MIAFWVVEWGKGAAMLLDGNMVLFAVGRWRNRSGW